MSSAIDMSSGVKQCSAAFLLAGTWSSLVHRVRFKHVIDFIHFILHVAPSCGAGTTAREKEERSQKLGQNALGAFPNEFPTPPSAPPGKMPAALGSLLCVKGMPA
jgi:hypothetical protein